MRRLEEIGGLSVGTVIAGKYRVDRFLGRGGMGVVVAATHLELLEPRAIKLMLSWAAGDPEMAQRFLREARIAARLKSEHVAKVHDVGRLDNGAPYMVMEYLEGRDLRAVRKQSGILGIEDAVHYVLQACDGLAEAHAGGLVHRDIKPSNLFLTRGLDGSPSIKLLDFGISKAPGPGSPEEEEMRTSTGQMLGTPHFMPPEQMLGNRDIDARADIYALGVLLYLLLTGRYPLQANSVQVVAIVLRGDYVVPPPLEIRPDLPRGLNDAILRCLERDRERRFRNVAELVRALEPFAPTRARLLVERIERILAEPPQPLVVSGAQPPSLAASSENSPLGTASSKVQILRSSELQASIGPSLAPTASIGPSLGAPSSIGPSLGAPSSIGRSISVQTTGDTAALGLGVPSSRVEFTTTLPTVSTVTQGDSLFDSDALSSSTLAGRSLSSTRKATVTDIAVITEPRRRWTSVVLGVLSLLLASFAGAFFAVRLARVPAGSEAVAALPTAAPAPASKAEDVAASSPPLVVAPMLGTTSAPMPDAHAAVLSSAPANPAASSPSPVVSARAGVLAKGSLNAAVRHDVKQKPLAEKPVVLPSPGESTPNRHSF